MRQIACGIQTVAELIEQLSKLPPYFTVGVYGEIGVAIFKEDSATAGPNVTIDIEESPYPVNIGCPYD
ncbi:MAG: hypothetical protein AB7C95_00835 [Synergistaceae bacterium]